MKKFKHYSHVLCLLLLIFVVSCQENELSKQEVAKVQVVDGRLSFKDLDQFLQTFGEIGEERAEISDGRLSGLNYNSYFNSLNHPKDPEDFMEGALDFFEYQILLNRNKEVQIGEKVYRIDNEYTKVLDLEGRELQTTKNEFAVYNKDKNAFETLKGTKGAKDFGVFYTEQLPYHITNPQVKYRFVRSSVSLFYVYKYEAKYYLGSGTALTNAEYWEREISDCICEIQNPNPYGGISYNISGVSYHCGISSRSHANTYGVNLRAEYAIKQNATTPPFAIAHGFPL